MPSADCTVAKQGAYEGYETSCRSYGFLVRSILSLRVPSEKDRSSRRSL